MALGTNHSLSVDCTIFGYDEEGLKVLLIEAVGAPATKDGQVRLKLPGGTIHSEETIPEAARRVLNEVTGLERVYLKQTEIFSDPNRVYGAELEWIQRSHELMVSRFITVGFYALVRLTPSIMRATKQRGSRWCKYDSIPHLALDHTAILKHALSVLRTDFALTPIAFALLPKKFTIRELQALYSSVMGLELDSRNFRKKILGTYLLKHTGEKECGVAHKPAEFFSFNQSALRKSLKKGLRYL